MFVRLEDTQMSEFKRKVGTLVVALFASLSLAIPLALAAQPDEDDPEVIKNCPAACRTIEYNSFMWFVECFGLPRQCSANPNGRHMLTQRDLRVR